MDQKSSSKKVVIDHSLYGTVWVDIDCNLTKKIQPQSQIKKIKKKSRPS